MPTNWLSRFCSPGESSQSQRSDAFAPCINLSLPSSKIGIKLDNNAFGGVQADQSSLRAPDSSRAVTALDLLAYRDCCDRTPLHNAI
jgi:hypothetical protein